VVSLKDILKEKTLILGIGNALKQDDGAGPALIKKLQGRSRTGLELIDGGTAPENFSGKIKEFKPGTLILADAVDLKAEPGAFRIIEAERFGLDSFSTHNIPFPVFISYLKEALPELKVYVLGIQPKRVALGEGLSLEVSQAIEKICMVID
jgi:hydrogenase 3 maturation protease